MERVVAVRGIGELSSRKVAFGRGWVVSSLLSAFFLIGYFLRFLLLVIRGTYSVEELASLLMEFILSISVHYFVLKNCSIQSIGEDAHKLPQ